MRFKRTISSLLILMIMIQFVLCTSATASSIDTEIAIEDAEKNQLIDELFSQRMALEHDYEGNRDRINEIDQQLEQLGVETLRTSEDLSLLCDDGAVPLWEPISTSTIRWTSRKLITTYRGYHYELQIIEGVPLSGDSELRKNYTKVNYRAEGITAGITKAIIASAFCYAESTGTSIAAEFVGNKLNQGITLLDMVFEAGEEIKESLSTSTVLDRVEGSAVISFTGHMKYIYVKPYQTTDAAYQGLFYIGNSVSSIITTVSVVDVMINNQLVTYHSVTTRAEDTVRSEYYDDYSQAVANYCDYHYNHNGNFHQDYTVFYMNLDILGSTNNYALPWARHPATISE
ncbi:MAG: hypothetical protein ACI4PO_05725 [Faecousia sp.]